MTTAKPLASTDRDSNAASIKGNPIDAHTTM